MIEIIKADGKKEVSFLDKLKKRNSQTENDVADKVKSIIEDIKNNGDEALNRYSLKFDNAAVNEVKKGEIEAAYRAADKKFITALENAAKNIFDFHSRQKRQGFTVAEKEGIILGYRITPLERVGLYVPGGTAAYPSSVLMNAIPAKIAGVKEIVMITPPSKSGGANPDILAAAYVCGIDRVFLAGGAHGIAALAFGTETIPKADKIVGPGNIYVATAKKLLFGIVDIDMIAGPSEILIIADKDADPSYVAADMMSQAEHDRLSSSILITDCESLAENVKTELKKQMPQMRRKEIIESSLANYGAVIITPDIKRAVEISNLIAPEHLEIMTKNPFDLLSLVTNAGSVFLGYYSPEPLGDYYAGPNHVLPTSGTAKFFSSLCVDSFIKKSGFTYYTRQALKDCKEDILCIADKEGLYAHANSVSVRFKD